MITWIDIMIMVILLACVIVGTVRGVMKSVYSVGKIILCVVASKILSPMLSEWIIGHTPVVAKIQEIFQKKS